jgi:hypothetical protein
MVVWNNQSCREELCLGNRVQQIDLWGRDRQLSEVRRGGILRQQIQVGRLPTFVTGLDASLMHWRLAVQFDSQDLASVFGRQQALGLQFKNTFRQGVGGTVTLDTPSTWEIDERKLRFKLASEESHHAPYGVLLGANASSGPQRVRLDFDVTADRDYRFSVYRTMQVGLGDVEIEVSRRFDEAGNLIVEQHLVNHSDELISFQCYLFAPNHRRQRRRIFNLAQGRTSVVFVLPDGRDLLGETLWLRAEEIGGVRILNREITVADES